jgi:3-hydroxyacyl-CoA dehydrogenase
MSKGIRTACVLGAGVMGSAIAAQFANAGIRTYLLDLPTSEPGASRSRIAEGALARALKTKPAPFYSADAARLVEPGNFDDDLARLRECDLVVEAIVENLKIKGELFSRVVPCLSEHAILASNTSGLSIAAMSATLPPDVQKRFVVMHFFNPVRYMHLVEVAAGPHTDAAVLERVARFGEYLGKGIVHAKDTTNFVANRIGVHALMHALHSLEQSGLGIDGIDLVTGKPMARSAGATFKTADIVGLDTLVHVSQNCYDTLVKDPEREVFRIPAVLASLIQAGRLGRKAGAGFYKKVGDDILVYDPAS